MEVTKKTWRQGTRSCVEWFAIYLLLVCMKLEVLGVQLDIHLKLSPRSGCLYHTAVMCNERLHEYSRNKTSMDNVSGDSELVNFNCTLPHVTLYLTDFDIQLPSPADEYGQETEDDEMDVDTRMSRRLGKHDNDSSSSPSSMSSLDELRQNLQSTLEAAAASHYPFITCPLRASLSSDHTSVVSGAYAMYQILNEVSPNEFDILDSQNSDEDDITKNNPSKLSHIQLLSDTIVNSTLIRSHVSPFAYEDVPQWVIDLPKSNPKRSVLIHNVKKYGSPNVFSQFVPHLTVGYDEHGSALARKEILDGVLEGDTGDGERYECCCHHCRAELVTEIGIGLVGDYGTVIRDLAVIPLNGAGSSVVCNGAQASAGDDTSQSDFHAQTFVPSKEQGIEEK